jgi:AcrR family transcriptional regulator
MSKGALYYYFADKDDLYRTVLKDYSEKLLDIWSGGPAKELPAFSRVKTPEGYWIEWANHWRRSLTYHRGNPLYAALFGQCIRVRASGTSHPALGEIAVEIREWVREVLRRGQRIGAVRTDLEEELLLETSFSMMEGFDRWVAKQRESGSEPPIDDLAGLAAGFLRRIVEPLTKNTHNRKPLHKRERP